MAMHAGNVAPVKIVASVRVWVDFLENFEADAAGDVVKDAELRGSGFHEQIQVGLFIESEP